MPTLSTIRRAASLAAAIVTLAAPTVAAAQNIQFMTSPPNPSTTAFGYYVGPFTGNLLNSHPSVIDLFCMDILNEVSFGETWTTSFSSLGGSLGATRHGDAAFDTYRKEAWLATQYSLNPTSEWGGIQTAAWALFNPGVIDGGASMQQWLTAANTTDLSSFDVSNFTIETDVNAAGLNVGGVQEFITPTVTPEPASMVLFGTGLLTIVGTVMVRRRRVS